ncbi:YhdP family protein [Castellaniella defragrans]|uniref:YhdP family protein n=1 Tax=Castellaniella defragrans TaxID=75697 RepID=UPI0023F0F65C|nr:YhdP family protein [Castellaniella defragrans]
MRQSISRRGSSWGRRLLAVAVGLYFCLGIALLALRYAVLPQIDAWRPRIDARLSQALGIQVELGPIQVRWHGWKPEFDVRGTRLRAADGRDLLTLPEARVRLDWRAALPGRRGLLDLRVRGMDLTLDRLPDGRLSLLGQTLDLGGTQDLGGAPALGWLLAQPRIAFLDTTLRWVDQARAAPELRLEGVEAVLAREAGGALGVSLSARVPDAADARLDLRAQLADPDGLAHGRLPSDWQAWLRVGPVRSRAWRPWVELPDALLQGGVQAQAWVQTRRGRPRLTLLLGTDAVRWAADSGLSLDMPRAGIWAAGALDQWQALGQGEPMPDGLDFQVRSQGARGTVPALFAQPLSLGFLEIRGRLRHADAWTLNLEELAWRNPDIALRGAGTWRSGGPAGQVDFQGTIARARLDAVHRYLPLEVSPEAREWLAGGLHAGEVVDARWRLQGDLTEFPFGLQPQAGDFRLQGNFRGARIEFVPGAPQKEAWPLLEDVAGTLDLHRTDLRLTASTARMRPDSGHEIALWGVKARIPDLEHDSTLQVSGRTAASGEAYMALIRHSPLAALLDGVFDEASAGGDWEVPLSLTIPLLHGEDTQVQGRVDLRQASLQFLPHAPAFQAIDGQLHFSEQGVRIARPLAARLLGGDVKIGGSLGGPQDTGLDLQGRIGARALADYVGVPGMRRLEGALDYRATLRRRGHETAFVLESDTRGLALDFPAPLAKPAEQARTLRIQWSDADSRSDRLAAQYGEALRLDLRHERKTRGGPYFQGASVGVGRAADADEDGLRVEVAYPLFDLDLWNRIVDEFSIPRRGGAGAGAGAGTGTGAGTGADNGARRKAGRPLWPDLTLLSIQADQLRLLGTRLDQAVLRVVRSPEEQWSMNLRSEQSSGTLKWQERDGRVLGRMSARFARLSLGDDANDAGSLLPEAGSDEDASFDDDLEIPGIVLQADELRLYGHSMGALSLEGVRDGAHHVWQLNNLRLGDDDARLRGSGIWRLRGADRGLELNASVQARSLGAWMDRAGWKDVMSGGEGTLKGRFQWRNLPWTREKADLSGSLRIELDKGRFQKIGSHTAKLLEFLSLQSITRLTKLDRGLAGLPQDGFPFDQLRSALELDRGKVKISDYKVIGPVGTILLEGSTDILHETLDMQAVIVPNLDVSGAALAAGIAVNPLVGLGAFVTQWLLKAPLAKSMTARYRVTGTWDEPKVTEIPTEAGVQDAGGG